MTDFTSPYARTLGLKLGQQDGQPLVTMPGGDAVLGRPGYLHGGAIAGLLDYAAWVTMLASLDDGVTIKPISITVEFLRGGRLVDTFGSARIERHGRRLANVVATAWQDDAGTAIASAHVKFLIA